MKPNSESKKTEDCVDIILEYYERECKGDKFEVDNKVWLNNANYLRQLMDKLDDGVDDYENIRNCLILLINLCFGIDSADIYESKGKSAQELSNGEKKDYRALLREEEEKEEGSMKEDSI